MLKSSRRNKNVKRNNRKRKGNRKARGPAKVSQLQTVNSNHPKPQVFKKTVLASASGAGNVGGGLAVAQLGGALASSMPDWSSIIALYNRYKMLKVTYTFNCQGLDGNTLFNLDLPKMLVRYNYDSNLSSSGILGKMQEIPNTKQFQFTPDKTSFSYSYYPRCIEPVYLSGVSTGYKLAKQQYIDVQYGSVPHYGIMWYIDNLAIGIKITYDISYSVAFKYQD